MPIINIDILDEFGGPFIHPLCIRRMLWPGSGAARPDQIVAGDE